MSDLARTDAALPTSPGDLEGWTAADLGSWLETAAPALVVLERRTDAARVSVGLALWKLRQELSEGDYGREVTRLAGLAEVDPGTLRRWRAKAENALSLPPPAPAAKRVESRRQAQLRAPRAESAIDTTAEQVPNAHLIDVDPIPEKARQRGAETRQSGAASGKGTSDEGPGSGNAPDSGPGSTVSGNSDPLAAAAGRLYAASADELAAAYPHPELLRTIAYTATKAARVTEDALRAASGGCAHPKAKEQRHAWGVTCGECGVKIR